MTCVSGLLGLEYTDYDLANFGKGHDFVSNTVAAWSVCCLIFLVSTT